MIMDFSKFDSRARAEVGTPMQIMDPWTGEPMMDGEKPCRVVVRGSASKTMQAKMRAKQRAAMAAHKKGNGDDEARVMEDVHNQLCEGAEPFIVGFENVNRGDRPCVVGGFEMVDVYKVDEEYEYVVDDLGDKIVIGQERQTDVAWFLGLEFPEMGVKEDEDGDPIMEDGTPVFEMKNNPFAKQVGEFAGKQSNHMGNVKKG
jgi:hypothetical protein